MSGTIADHLKALHSGEIQARAAYQEALEDAEERGMTPLFKEIIALHTKNANELAVALTNLGELDDPAGSHLGSANRTRINIRALFSGRDEAILPALSDGEKRNLDCYDQVLRLPALPDMTRALIEHQHKRLLAAVTSMQVTMQPPTNSTSD